MELHQLKYFQTIAHTRSVTEAAEELFVSQSTLSQCISRLENSIGCSLFYRHKGKKLVLTDAGRNLLNTVDHLLPELDQGIVQTRLIGNGYAPQVSIASALHFITGSIVAEYLSKNNESKISYKNVEVNSLQDLLLSSEIDLALAPCPIADDRIECEALYNEEMLLFVGPNHHLIGKKSVRLEDLINEKYICNFGETDRFFMLRMLFESKNINIITESSDVNTIYELVNADIGVTFVPAGVARNIVKKRHGNREQFIKLTDYTFPVPYCIWRKKNKEISKDAETFYQFIVNYTKREFEKNKVFLMYYK